MPPGRVTIASANSAMRRLRSVMESTTSRLVSPEWRISPSSSAWVMTPWTSIPASRAVSAATPINPTEPPP